MNLIALEVVDSTNAEALRRLRAGAPDGTVICAETQTAGRGRRGRAWVSPPGNLHMSIVVRDVDGAAAGQLSYVSALAVGDAVGPAASFKWPNDILLNGKKAGGILIEAESAQNRLIGLVVGIGVNNLHAPENTEFPATSLAAARLPPVAAADIASRFAAWRARWQEGGFAPIREQWLARAVGLGSGMAARLPNATLTGIFAGIDAAGALLLDGVDGDRRTIAAADVFLAV
jgi:BirA family transcriptional regulator, biotin operon repressor / biotin---[acetyl-CoA-carboxylase] ligase